MRVVSEPASRDAVLPHGRIGFSGPRLIAAARMAFDPRKLAIAALGLLLLRLGWAGLDRVLGGPIGAMPRHAERKAGPIFDWLDQAAGRLAEPVEFLTGPLRTLFDPKTDWGEMAHALLGLAWVFAVWGVCGGAIARLAMLQNAEMRQPRIGEGLRFGLRRAPSLVAAPFLPLIALACSATVGLFFGWIYRIPGGDVVAGLGAVFTLLAGLVMAIFALGLVAGWPLFAPAIAAGADDALDALSRTLSYLNQRFGRYLIGIFLAGAIGLAGLVVVDLLAEGAVHFARWAVGLSAGESLAAAAFSPDAGLPGAAGALHRFWLNVVRLLEQSWIHAYFWTAGAALYLWLRADVDGTPSEEIRPPARFESLRPVHGQAAPDVAPAKDGVVSEA